MISNHVRSTFFNCPLSIEKRAALGSPFCLASSSASATLVGILAHAGELAVGLGHKCLQLLFKQLVCSLGSGRLDRGTLGTVLFPVTVLETAILPGLEAAAFPALEIAALTALEIAGVFPLGLGLQTLDGQVDLAVFVSDDHDLHILTLGQMLTDITDIGIGNLRNMYQFWRVRCPAGEQDRYGTYF